MPQTYHTSRRCSCGRDVQLSFDCSDVPIAATGRKVKCECGLVHEDHWIMKKVEIVSRLTVDKSRQSKCYFCGKDATWAFIVRVPVMAPRLVCCCDNDECQSPSNVENEASELNRQLLNSWL